LRRSTISEEDILRDIVVAIDGPAGSGKSSTAKRVAKELGHRHIDTGAMYRAVALKALRAGVDPDDGDACGELAGSIQITFGKTRDGEQTVLADGEDVSRDIRSPEVTRAVSPVSAHPSVRSAMVRQQRSLAEAGGAVLEGRDIGTVVLPSAEVKIFLVASTTVRAERRLKELRESGLAVDAGKVERDIIRRDEYDSAREASPLKRAVGSVEVDTTNLTIEEQVGRIVGIVRETAADLAGLVSKRRNPFAKKRPWFRFGQMVARGVFRVVFGLRVDRKMKVDYEENYIYACNHVSYADPPSVGSTLPREVHFVAKSTLFENRFFGWLIRSVNAMPLRRGVFDREAVEKSVKLLNAGGSLMIFPEGQRQFGGRLGRPKSGVGLLAVTTGVAVVPAYVRGTDRLSRCLIRRMRLRVVQGRPIRMAKGTSEEFTDRDSHRAYSDMVMEAIQALKDEGESDQ
jgi:cytidylate kinase